METNDTFHKAINSIINKIESNLLCCLLTLLSLFESKFCDNVGVWEWDDSCVVGVPTEDTDSISVLCLWFVSPLLFKLLPLLLLLFEVLWVLFELPPILIPPLIVPFISDGELRLFRLWLLLLLVEFVFKFVLLITTFSIDSDSRWDE